MYIAASHIDVKLKQDYADFFIDEKEIGLVICDGIGEFKDSGIVAQTVAELFTEKRMLTVDVIIHSKSLENLRKKEIIGGTTYISAVADLKNNRVKIQYLGNGGIIQFRGDYADNPNSDLPYRYADLMIPHIAPDGSLTKHISNNSGKDELNATEIKLKFSTVVGDILLFYSDGIGSLENNIILKDEEQRYWRYENDNIQLILQDLDTFLQKAKFSINIQDQLTVFCNSVLSKLYKEDRLEDDASLGIILTNQVIDLYKSKRND